MDHAGDPPMVAPARGVIDSGRSGRAVKEMLVGWCGRRERSDRATADLDFLDGPDATPTFHARVRTWRRAEGPQTCPHPD